MSVWEWKGDLVDGEAMHRKHPSTFAIPTLRERYNVKPGQQVKLGFTRELASGSIAERMWVTITRTTMEGAERFFFGTLDNTPALFDMRAGDPVGPFRCAHILDVGDLPS